MAVAIKSETYRCWLRLLSGSRRQYVQVADSFSTTGWAGRYTTELTTVICHAVDNDQLRSTSSVVVRNGEISTAVDVTVIVEPRD